MYVIRAMFVFREMTCILSLLLDASVRWCLFLFLQSFWKQRRYESLRAVLSDRLNDKLWRERDRESYLVWKRCMMHFAFLWMTVDSSEFKLMSNAVKTLGPIKFYGLLTKHNVQFSFELYFQRPSFGKKKFWSPNCIM